MPVQFHFEGELMKFFVIFGQTAFAIAWLSQSHPKNELYPIYMVHYYMAVGTMLMC